MRPKPLLSIALTAGLVGCAQGPSTSAPQGSSADGLVHVPLAASRWNAGETAWATLVGRGDKTDATIRASGVPPQVGRPIHLYTYIHGGTCGALSARPAYSLTDVVLARSGGATGYMGPPYTVANTVEVRLSDLRATPHALVVRSAPADGNLELFCGNIAVGLPNDGRKVSGT